MSWKIRYVFKPSHFNFMEKQSNATNTKQYFERMYITDLVTSRATAMMESSRLSNLSILAQIRQDYFFWNSPIIHYFNKYSQPAVPAGGRGWGTARPLPALLELSAGGGTTHPRPLFHVYNTPSHVQTLGHQVQCLFSPARHSPHLLSITDPSHRGSPLLLW